MVFRKLFGKKEEEKPKAIGISRGARRTNLFLKIIWIEKLKSALFELPKRYRYSNRSKIFIFFRFSQKFHSDEP